MSNTVFKRSLKSVTISLVSQLIIMILGFVLPRMLIKSFGSEVNGFFGTLTQVYSYLEMLRAGVGMAAIQALYKPINDNDIAGISSVVSSSRAYFRKIGYIYLVLTLIISLGFVFVGNVSLSKIEIFIIAAMQGVAGWISFSKINWFVDLLRAEGKNYVFVTIQTIGSIAFKLIEIVLIYYTQNPILVKSVALIITLIEYFAFEIYRRKEYSKYNFKIKEELSLLKNRGAYFVFHIASMICSNTDVVVISLFCGYEISSVYSIYYMIVAGVNALINTVYSSTAFVLGHAYQKGLQYFEKVHDAFYVVYLTFTTALFSICYVLFLPFINLYTSGIQDVNYIYEYLPFLFCIIQIIACGKNVGDMTINVGGLARKVVWRSILEASINIIISLVLVQFIGIYGVLIGTIVATFYRLVDVMLFSNRNVLKRPPTKCIFILIVNLCLFMLTTIFDRYINIKLGNYLEFIILGIIVTPIILLLYFAVVMIICPKERVMIFSKLKSIRRKSYNDTLH